MYYVMDWCDDLLTQEAVTRFKLKQQTNKV
jgi:hypothetical protein